MTILQINTHTHTPVGAHLSGGEGKACTTGNYMDVGSE